jgi:hypothetical protein
VIVMNTSFHSFVLSHLSATSIAELLGSTSAVVLERIARGGGATRWYYCDGPGRLDALALKVKPGSRISFYFDQRIRRDCNHAEALASISRILAETGEVMIGVLQEDGLEIKDEIITRGELPDYEPWLRSSSTVFYGVFPMPDNDGYNAVTLNLPDADGVVRPHPH